MAMALCITQYNPLYREHFVMHYIRCIVLDLNILQKGYIYGYIIHYAASLGYTETIPHRLTLNILRYSRWNRHIIQRVTYNIVK